MGHYASEMQVKTSEKFTISNRILDVLEQEVNILYRFIEELEWNEIDSVDTYIDSISNHENINAIKYEKGLIKDHTSNMIQYIRAIDESMDICLALINIMLKRKK